MIFEQTVLNLIKGLVKKDSRAWVAPRPQAVPVQLATVTAVRRPPAQVATGRDPGLLSYHACLAAAAEAARRTSARCPTRLCAEPASGKLLAGGAALCAFAGLWPHVPPSLVSALFVAP